MEQSEKRWLLLGFDDDTNEFTHEEFFTEPEAEEKMAQEFCSVYGADSVARVLLETDESQAGYNPKAGIAWLRDIHGVNYDWQVTSMETKGTLWLSVVAEKEDGRIWEINPYNACTSMAEALKAARFYEENCKCHVIWIYERLKDGREVVRWLKRIEERLRN